VREHNKVVRQPHFYSKKENVHQDNLSPIYFFEDAGKKDRMVLGGKGAGLVELTKLGLPVPAGFIITTNVCSEFYQLGQKLPDYLMDMIDSSIKRLEKKTGKIFGDPHNPLFVSVRSGAAVSMPGMMDTILNLGLNNSTIRGLINQGARGRRIAGYDNTKFAYNSYIRFIEMFGRIVLRVQEQEFKDIDKILTEKDRIRSSAARKKEKVIVDDVNCQQEGRERKEEDDHDDEYHYYFQNIVARLKEICKQKSGKEFPDNPYEQIRMAVEAVFRSWMGRRAVEYRKQYRITPNLANGTAVIVCEMVFGNMDNNSATGVVFTRNPETGEKKLYGEYLVNAQGEDIVSGEVTPKHITPRLSDEFPQVYSELVRICDKLERYFKEPQDIEITIERGKLYVLQTRTAKMNGIATVKTSVDMYYEGLINKKKSIMRIETSSVEQFLYPRVDNIKNKSRPIAKGIGASPGVATGIAIFETDKAEVLGKKGEKVILIREETKPEDVPAFFQSSGILTSKGGKTSHAAVVARGIGKPCVVGCSQISIDEKEKKMVVFLPPHVDATSKKEEEGEQQLKQKQHSQKQIIIIEGQKVTIDGTSGDLYDKEIPTTQSEFTQELKEVVQWASELKRVDIRANADTVQSAIIARNFGAEGIGLLRTERMFNQSDRLGKFVNMILANNIEERKRALEILKPLQKSDFKQILKVMQGFPVTIRLLDPPLHEFLPREQDLLMQLSELKSRYSDGFGDTGATTKIIAAIRHKEAILKRIRELSEVNPMLGHRGVRLAISFPEIYEMQIRAICEATAELMEEGVSNIRPQIMIPQVGIAEELFKIRSIFNKIVEDVQKKYNIPLTSSSTIKFGSMIEVVRACLVAGEIARVAAVDFISFGTNDLTQATFSFSREDAEGKFLPLYLNTNIFSFNPFQHIDTDGVGELMKIAVERVRKERGEEKTIEIGICGEHGGDPQSIDFCDNVVGVDYVSASVNRIPIAIIAAAQAAIRTRGRK
jgi:pyruvate, orthophosphate dikinase